MIFLLDTNTFSNLMREDSIVDAHLKGCASTDQVVICPIVRGEILFGIERLPMGKRRQRLQSMANLLFVQIPCVAIPESAGDYYSSVKLDTKHKGLSLQVNDIWIAATGLALGATVVTHDSDFQAIAGLPLVDWSV